MWKRVGRALLVLLVLVIGVLGYAFYNITSDGPHWGGGRVSAESPKMNQPPQAPHDRQREQAPAPARPREQVAGSSQESRPGDLGRFELRLTEEEANRLVADDPKVQEALRQRRVSAPRIEFEPGQVIVSGRAPLFGNFTARLRTVGTIWVENGNLRYRTEQVNVGDFPAPGPLRDELDRQLVNIIAKLNERFEGRVEEVELTSDALVVRGRS